jgi:hypothetical protein
MVAISPNPTLEIMRAKMSLISAFHCHFGFAIALIVSAASAAAMPPDTSNNLYIVGQDLDALRGYYKSKCCAVPDGTTAYLSLYNLLNANANYGGLGVDKQLRPVDSEKGWGSGAQSAWKSAMMFGATRLAIGLNIAENGQPKGLSRIASGEYDPQIDQLAAFAKKIDKPLFLRIGYEFDGQWNKGYENQPNFIAAWRRIVDRLRAEGADKVQTVWQASASPYDDILDGWHEDIGGWYPGDDYVDWIGGSWFLARGAKPTVKGLPYYPVSARVLMDEAVSFARARRKPFMIAECSTQGYDLQRRTYRNITALWDGVPGNGRRKLTDAALWDEWYAPLFDYLKANADVIRAVAYINVNWDSQPMWGPPYNEGYWGDSRLEVNPFIAARWNKAIGDWRASGSAH